MTIRQLEENVARMKCKHLISRDFKITFVRLARQNVAFAFGTDNLNVLKWDFNGHCFVDHGTSIEIGYNEDGEPETVEVLLFKPYPKLDMDIH